MRHPTPAATSSPRRSAAAERDAAVVVEHDAVDGDRWLLCSDGLSDYVPDAEIARCSRQPAGASTPRPRCVALALEAGTRDNVTAVVCDVVRMPRRGAPADAAREPTFYGAAAVRFTEGLESA